VDSLLGLLVPQVDGAAHVGGLATGFASGLALSRPWPPPPAAYAPRRRLAAAGLLAAGLVVLIVALMPGIRARLKREPAIIAYDDSQVAQKAYTTFVRAIGQATDRYEAIDEELDEWTSRLNRRAMPVGPAIEALGRLTSRAEANAGALRTLPVKEPELRVALDRLASALSHQHQALDALRHYLETRDRRLLEGAGSYKAHLRSGGEEIRSFNESCARYLKAHGLTSTAP
jgi:rhomboid protease GluP